MPNPNIVKIRQVHKENRNVDWLHLFVEKAILALYFRRYSLK